jgi:hypothetical protein
MATEPQFPPSQDMRDVSPEDVAEAKKRAKATKAYNQSLTTMEPAPKKEPTPKKEPVKGMRKGGYVRSADGIAQRGKTRGKMV